MPRAATIAVLRLKRATKLAVQVAGGLQECASATGLSTSQLSRCCTAEAADSLAIRDAEILDSLSLTGHRHILHELAALAGHVLVPLPQGQDDAQLIQGVAALATELGDVARSVTAALADGACTPREAQAALDEVAEMEAATARLRGQLMALAYPDAERKAAAA